MGTSFIASVQMSCDLICHIQHKYCIMLKYCTVPSFHSHMYIQTERKKNRGVFTIKVNGRHFVIYAQYILSEDSMLA